MSIALLDKAGLRWWREPELEYRDMCVKMLNTCIQDTLKTMNPAWRFVKTEAPMLIPASMISPAYDENDVFFCDARLGEEKAVMRPETTSGSYMMAQHLLKTTKLQLPLGVWQVGKSYRVEASDGASASRLRYNEFTQAEWQCIYGLTTKADYQTTVLQILSGLTKWLCKADDVRVIASDRLPSYSTKTMDIEVRIQNGRWTEIASCSLRTDYPDAHVLEIAFGIDRIVDIAWLD